MKFLNWSENLLQDIRFASRTLRRSPGFMTTGMLALALGIGANTAIFTVVNTVLLQPLAYPEPDRLVQLELSSPQGNGNVTSIPKFNVWREQTQAFQDVAAYDFGGPGVNLTGGDRPEQLKGIRVSAGFFPVFGARLAAGRTFSTEEDRPGGPALVVVSGGLWRRRFRADPNLVGKSSAIGDEPYTVTCTLDPEFGTDPPADVYGLTRATIRKREIAIRAAIGAGRGRLIRQLLTESVLLSLSGGVLGLLLGYLGVRALLGINSGNIPRIGERGSAVMLDWRVLLFTLIASVLTGILFGLIPAFNISRTDINETLKESGQRSGGGLRQNKARSNLVVSEVALALVLLMGAGLLIRTFLALRCVNPGFDPQTVLTMEMSLTGTRFETTPAVDQLVRDAERRVASLPGVASIASTCCLPLEGGFGLPFTIEGRPLANGPFHGGGSWRTVS